jgi:hypothetical protein
VVLYDKTNKMQFILLGYLQPQLLPQEQLSPHWQFSSHLQAWEKHVHPDLEKHPQCLSGVHTQFWQWQLVLVIIGAGAAERILTAIRETPKKLNNAFIISPVLLLTKSLYYFYNSL